MQAHRSRVAGRGWRRPIVVLSLLAVVASAAVSVPGLVRPVLAGQPAAGSTTIPASFADLVAAARPAVVNISVSGPGTGRVSFGGSAPPGDTPLREFFERFLDRAPPGAPRGGVDLPVRSVGSGFIVSPEGHIVTNFHVVAGASEIAVTLDDGRRFPAILVGTDEKTDLALLAVEADTTLPYIEFGDSDRTRVGDWVLAVGNPFGLGGTFTAGIVSARGRDIRSGPFDDFLQVDAPINQGNSGGPLFNTRGEVIGINTAIFSPTGGSVGIGFAVPSALAEPVVAQLRNLGRVDRGWLGVQIQPVGPEIAEALSLPSPAGALVADVVDGSPAARAGVRVGDVIVAVDGREVETARALPRLVGEKKEGETVALDVLRDDGRQRVDAVLGRSPAAPRVARTTPPTRESAAPDLGLEVVTASPEVRTRFGLGDDVRGAVVTGVAPGAAAAGQVRPGDVIVMVGRERIESVPDLAREVRSAAERGRETVLLLVDRAGARRYVAVPVS